MENECPGKIGKVVFRGKVLKIIKTAYSTNGRVAIELKSDGVPLAVLSVNLPDEEFEEGEFAVKNWSENEEIAPFILEHTDLFEDTGKRIPTGWVESQVWRFKNA